MNQVKFNTQTQPFFQALRTRTDHYFKTNKISTKGDSRLYWKTAILSITFVAIYITLIFLTPESVWINLILCALLGANFAAIGFNMMHDGAHGSYSDNKFLNESMGFTLNIMGGNMYVWKQKHNENHHTFTNIEGHDDDINLKPFLRMHENQQKLWIHRYQHFYGVFMYGMSLMFWVFYQDFKRYFTGQIAEQTNMRKMKTSDHLIFWSSKFLHILLFILIPMYTVGVIDAIVGYITMSYVCGIILGIVFQMAHVVEPTSFIAPTQGIETLEDEWAVHQIKTTFDFATKSKVVCWLLGGLNFQVEHHLFPRISHVHYPELRKIVRETCDEFSVRYHEFPTVLKAFRSHLSYLRTIGRA